MSASTLPDPKLDLAIERTVDVAPALLWRGWTEPEQLMKWFTPRPWSTVRCEIDLRPGGSFHAVMRSPEGDEHPNDGCYLEVVPNERLVWTNALGASFRPAARGEVPMITAIITFAPQGAGTRYTATALHASQADCEKHEAMGFYAGWNAALDQLVEAAKAM